MLEIAGKDKTPDKDKFATEMVNLQIETVNKITDICAKYSLNPFETIKVFGTHLYQSGADMQAKFKAEHGDIFADSGEENDEGGET